MELYEKIQYLRTTKGLTQARLAEKIGVSRQSVQKWEAGTTAPDIGKLPGLAQLLGVTVDALLDPRLSPDELMAQNGAASRATTRQDSGILRRRSLVDYLLLLPVGLGIGLGVGMFYLFGAMLAGMGFILALFCLAGGVLALPLTILNIPHGSGAVLLGVSGIFLGLGAACPVFRLSQTWWKTYRILTAKLTLRLKKTDFRSFL